MDAILHIGPHKTGSSSIQMAMRLNVDLLKQQGFLTASHLDKAASALPLPFQSEWAFHPNLKRTFRTWADAQALGEQQWTRLEQSAKAHPDHTMILSSEHFSSLPDPSALIARLRRSFDRVVVMAYVRDPLDLYVSSIQQNIRGGRRLADLRVPSQFPFVISRQIDKYASLVGVENIVVRNFARSNLIGGDVVLDFFSTLSSLGRPVSLPSSFVNEAYPAPVVAWLLIMNEAYERVLETDERIALVARLDAIAELKPFAKLRLNVPEFEATIRARSREDCAWLNNSFLQGQETLRVSASARQSGLTEPEERSRMRQWILEALTPEALSLLMNATVSLKPSAGAPIGKRKAAKP